MQSRGHRSLGMKGRAEAGARSMDQEVSEGDGEAGLKKGQVNETGHKGSSEGQ